MASAAEDPVLRASNERTEGTYPGTDRRVGARLSADLYAIDCLASPGYDGQPAVYLYIAALEVNVLNRRWPGGAIASAESLVA